MSLASPLASTLRPRAAIAESIGRTPLLRLSRCSDRVPPTVTIWAKAEFLNPSGSVKDRPAWSIVRAAIDDGRLAGGKVLLDASSGNTAISYAMLGAALGFAVEVCLPRTVNPERLARIQAYGAEVVLTDPAEGTDGAQREARRLAESKPNRYFYADQYNNPANPGAHYRTTGPEIWAQTGGRITHLVAGVGTGGTLSGTARYLRERSDVIQIVGVEPDGPLHGLEGLKHLPTALRPTTYDPGVVDSTIRVSTEDARAMCRRLLRAEGLDVGPSSGAAVQASVDLARRLSSGLIVTVLPDRGDGRGREDSP